MTKIVGLVAALVICFAVAAIGSWATMPSIPTWYASLAKPSWNPPAWLFGPVWTLLFAAMAVAVWLVWERAGFAGAPAALALFAIQLALNAGWSILFFAKRAPGAAFVEILFLWVAIALTSIAFAQVDRLAAWLLVPYLAWVSFAAFLNFTIWRLNP